MGWTFPWASSFGDDFNFDFNVSITEEQQLPGGVEYNCRRGDHPLTAAQVPARLCHAVVSLLDLGRRGSRGA
jgi:predicted dithiol-disulfide oxidoreductase (DUF899 family)